MRVTWDGALQITAVQPFKLFHLK